MSTINLTTMSAADLDRDNEALALLFLYAAGSANDTTEALELLTAWGNYTYLLPENVAFVSGKDGVSINVSDNFKGYPSEIAHLLKAVNDLGDFTVPATRSFELNESTTLVASLISDGVESNSLDVKKIYNDEVVTTHAARGYSFTETWTMFTKMDLRNAKSFLEGRTSAHDLLFG